MGDDAVERGTGRALQCAGEVVVMVETRDSGEPCHQKAGAEPAP